MRLAAASIEIGPLNRDHDRRGFDCGVDGLNRYIWEQARQDESRGIARLFVATAVGSPSAILGFYTLSAAAISPANLSPEFARRMPRHAVPAALVGRLAVDRRHAGQGLGGILLADAVLRAEVASEVIGIAVIVVDPLDEPARQFYRRFGFSDAAGAAQMYLVRKLKR